MYIDNMRNMRHELYGESVFTSFRVFNGKIPGFELHLQRLFEAVQETYSLKHVSFNEFYRYFYTSEQILKQAKNNPNSYCRITVFSQVNTGLNQIRFGLSDLCMNFEISPIKEEIKPVSLKSYLSPFSKNYVPIKSSSYFQQLHFKKLALKLHYNDCLFIVDGNISEASTSNIVFYKSGEYFFPEGNFFLQGITLEVFKKFCLNQSLSIKAKTISYKELSDYEGAFLLNSVKGLVPIYKIDEFDYAIDNIICVKRSFINFCEDSL